MGRSAKELTERVLDLLNVEPSPKAQNLACTDASMRELKILKAVASWAVLTWNLDGCLGTKPASQSSLSENQECSVLNHYALQEQHPV